VISDRLALRPCIGITFGHIGPIAFPTKYLSSQWFFNICCIVQFGLDIWFLGSKSLDTLCDMRGLCSPRKPVTSDRVRCPSLAGAVRARPPGARRGGHRAPPPHPRARRGDPGRPPVSHRTSPWALGLLGADGAQCSLCLTVQ